MKTVVIVVRYSSVSVLSRWVPETQVGGFFSASFKSFKTRLTQRLAPLWTLPTQLGISGEKSNKCLHLCQHLNQHLCQHLCHHTSGWICLSGMFCTRPNLSPLCDICKNIFNFISGNKSFPLSWTRYMRIWEVKKLSQGGNWLLSM